MSDAHPVTVSAHRPPPAAIGREGAVPPDREGSIPRTAPWPAHVSARSAGRRAAAALLARRLPGRAAGAVAAVRGRALVLVYHRVRPEPAMAHEVVPCVPVQPFRVQLETLLRLGEVVPLEQLPEPALPRRPGRPRFALTFDDDYATHVRYALPVLRELGVPATFFLSGRSLHGLGPYWWEVLESRIRADGADQVARDLDVAGSDPAAIARACEDDPARRSRLAAGAAGAADQLSPAGIAELAEAGMAVGFHTVAHDVLPRLDPAARRRALTDGRDRLQEHTGQPLAVLAYPHGKADAGTAADARAAGYRAAWTGAGCAVSAGSDRWRLGRWEAGPLDPATLRARALARLLRIPQADG